MKTMKAFRMILKVLPFVAAVIGLKLLVHEYDWEFVPLNAIFTALIGANVFLMGFLISGVMADYKEAERLPGEMASTILNIADELECIRYKGTHQENYQERLNYMLLLSETIRSWFFKKLKTRELMDRVDFLSSEFNQLDQLVPPNYIARLKQEQGNLRKTITRVHTIRETDFVFSGYFIAATTTILLNFGLIFLQIDPFYESLFFVGLVAYLLTFLIFLIHDLDNPFGQYDSNSFEDVSLKPLDDVIARLESRKKSL